MPVPKPKKEPREVGRVSGDRWERFRPMAAESAAFLVPQTETAPDRALPFLRGSGGWPKRE
jgi:hypothetical protein